MAESLKELVEKFAAELEAIVNRRATAAFAAKFDDVKAQFVGGAAPRTAPAAAKAPKARQLPARRPKADKRFGPIAAKPCPVCGKPNKGRRFSFLCENHRTPENLAKFKGASRRPKK